MDLIFFPSLFSFSFLGYLLNPDPTARPSIQQVQERLAALRGVPAPKQTTPPPSRAPVNAHIAQAQVLIYCISVLFVLFISFM